MKLSTTVEQACCILALLAMGDKQSAMTNEMLANVMGVSPTYLKKITRKLVVSGLIKSAPGAKGGFVFGRSCREITLDDVVCAVEGDASFFQPQGVIERVFHDNEREAEIGMSIIERVFHNAQEHWSKSLRQTTLADIVNEVTRA